MTPVRIVGIVLLVVGVVVFMMGQNASGSFTEQAQHAWTGNYSDRTTWELIGGIATGVLGLALLIFGGKLGPRKGG